MKLAFSLSVSVVVLFMSTSIIVGDCPTKSMSELIMPHNKKNNEQIQLKATFPERLNYRKEWPVVLTLQNKTNASLTISRYRHLDTDVKIVVRDEDGKQITRTEYGKKHLWGKPVKGMLVEFGSAKLTKIPPGELFTWPNVDFHKCFDLSPGKYNVEFNVSVRPVGEISQKNSIEVLPAKAINKNKDQK